MQQRIAKGLAIDGIEFMAAQTRHGGNHLVNVIRLAQRTRERRADVFLEIDAAQHAIGPHQVAQLRATVHEARDMKARKIRCGGRHPAQALGGCADTDEVRKILPDVLKHEHARLTVQYRRYVTTGGAQLAQPSCLVIQAVAQEHTHGGKLPEREKTHDRADRRSQVAQEEC